MRIIRVFPRRTNATPDDTLAFTAPPPKAIPEADEVHVSVTFTYDKYKAESLAESWMKTGLPVKLGGPAYGEPGGDFTPGIYLRRGYVLTSRGCPNSCWFCDVHRREGGIRELPVTEGWNILDSNILACSEPHIRAVFDMLKHQPGAWPSSKRGAFTTRPERPAFTGGLEAKRLKAWHVELLREAKTQRMYFAYDTADDLEPLIYAGKLLRDGGFTKASHTAKCYVLIGYAGDSFEKAEKRLREAWAAGFFPFAMLYRDNNGDTEQSWRQFQRLWARPQIVARQLQTTEVHI